MTKSDHIGFEQMNEALFGSLRVAPREIERGVNAMGLSFPLRIAAARLPSGKTPAPSGWHREMYFWHLHPGLVYVLWMGETTFTRRGWLHGEAQHCEEASAFIYHLQNAAVALRRRELAAVIQHDPLPLTFADELDARRLALRRIIEALDKRGTLADEHWQGALEVWLETILLRHQKHINSVHRRLTEFLSLMTCDLESDHGVANALRRLQRECFEFYSLSEVRHRFPAMIGELLREFPLRHALQNHELSPITAQALEWIEASFRYPVTVAECAAAIPVSASYLCRLLQRETGLSPVQHLQHRRIAQAKSLLQESRLSLYEIAGRSGFGSLEHFYRVFRAQTGLTPAAYRRNARKF